MEKKGEIRTGVFPSPDLAFLASPRDKWLEIDSYLRLNEEAAARVKNNLWPSLILEWGGSEGWSGKRPFYCWSRANQMSHFHPFRLFARQRIGFTQLSEVIFFKGRIHSLSPPTVFFILFFLMHRLILDLRSSVLRHTLTSIPTSLVEFNQPFYSQNGASDGTVCARLPPCISGCDPH